MAYKRFYQEYKKLAKRANQRMRELEQSKSVDGTKTPAYEAVQATLEMMGKRSGRATGRRFSESGKASFNEMEMAMKAIKTFLGQKTSTVSGYKAYRNQIWDSANRDGRLTKAGISRDEYFEIFRNEKWKNLDKVLGSDVVIDIIRAKSNKDRKMKRSDKLTPDDILQKIGEASDQKSAMRALGLNWKDMKDVKSL